MKSATVGLWKTNETTVRIHAATCPMLKTANRRILRLDAEAIEDMRERGYKIAPCKCTK